MSAAKGTIIAFDGDLYLKGSGVNKWYRLLPEEYTYNLDLLVDGGSATVIHEPDALDAVPAGTVVQFSEGEVALRLKNGLWELTGVSWQMTTEKAKCLFGAEYEVIKEGKE